MNLHKRAVIFDTETTGISVTDSRIVQFAFQEIKPDGKVRENSILLNPLVPIEPGASKVHGYTDQMVQGCPTFKSIADNLFTLLNDSYWLVYNGVRFDIPLLRNEFARVGIEPPVPVGILDGYKLFIRYHGNPKKKGTRTLTAAHEFYCGGGFENAHDALADVRATAEVIEAQLNTHKDTLEEYIKISERIPMEIDHRGVFRWGAGHRAVMGVGKYRDIPLDEIPLGYFQWMITSGSFSPDVIQIAKNALRGFFPVWKPIR